MDVRWLIKVWYRVRGFLAWRQAELPETTEKFPPAVARKYRMLAIARQEGDSRAVRRLLAQLMVSGYPLTKSLRDDLRAAEHYGANQSKR